MRSHVSLPAFVALPVGLFALACGSTAEPPPAAGESSGSSSPVTDPVPSQSLPSPTTGSGPGGTTGELSSTSMADGMDTVSPPLFDLGIPDMPMVEPPPIPDFDCSNVPDTHGGFQVINGPRGYHGLAITPDGRSIGSDGSSLIESTYDGDWGVFIPGIGLGQQMDWLVDGDLAHATSDSAITRVRLDATTEVIQPGVAAYGVVVGPDDQIYVTSNFGGAAISRIDPDTGSSALWLSSGGENVHSIGFNREGDRLYAGTIGDGNLYYVDIDNQMNPTTGLELLSNQVGIGNGWHDAVAVDICGYIYVPDYYSSNLYRISPSGETTVFWAPASQSYYAHGLTWGTGEHGWREDALYFPQPYNGNTVGEIIVGVPPAHWPANPINAPQPI